MNLWPQLSRPLEGDVFRSISLGAGVQSVTMCFMAARGDIGPMPDVAIFADTGGEARSTYEYLDYLSERVPFPVIRVSRAGPTLAEHAIAVAQGQVDRKGSCPPPWYTLDDRGRKAMMRKQCSGTYKRDVVQAELRRQMGFGPRDRIPARSAEQWLGISMDELTRVQEGRVAYTHLRYPLVEAGMDRRACVRWLEDRQFRVPRKSSCVFCPYRTNAQWRDLRDNEPDSFHDAILVDRAIRAGHAGHEGEAFVHRSFSPLETADLQDESLDQLGLPFGADCDGCGS